MVRISHDARHDMLRRPFPSTGFDFFPIARKNRYGFEGRKWALASTASDVHSNWAHRGPRGGSRPNEPREAIPHQGERKKGHRFRGEQASSDGCSPGRPPADRLEERLHAGLLRLLPGHPERRGRELLYDHHADRRRRRGGHHRGDRIARESSSPPAIFRRARGLPVRVLHSRLHRLGLRFAGKGVEARRGGRSGSPAGKCLPLHRVQADPRGHRFSRPSRKRLPR